MSLSPRKKRRLAVLSIDVLASAVGIPTNIASWIEIGGAEAGCLLNLGDWIVGVSRHTFQPYPEIGKNWHVNVHGAKWLNTENL